MFDQDCDGDEDYDDHDDNVCDDNVCDEDDDSRYLIDNVGFADPGGVSALRAATPDNPRDRPCPTCHAPNVLTRIDERRGYQCDRCAERAEGYGP